MLDAGVKTCGVDQGMPALVAEDAAQIAANEEHLLLYGYTGREVEGEKLRLIPGHCSSTVNQQDKIYLVDGEQVVGRLLITARKMGR